jgi:hypothetical protein
MSPTSKSVTTAISVLALSSSFVASKAFLNAADSALEAPVHPTNYAMVCFRLLILLLLSAKEAKLSSADFAFSPAFSASSPTALREGEAPLAASSIGFIPLSTNSNNLTVSN